MICEGRLGDSPEINGVICKYWSWNVLLILYLPSSSFWKVKRERIHWLVAASDIHRGGPGKGDFVFTDMVFNRFHGPFSAGHKFIHKYKMAGSVSKEATSGSAYAKKATYLT